MAYEHREVVLKNKPASMLALSPKGTVPVLWLPTATDEADVMRCIAYNDGPFKQHLDRYKYPQRAGLSIGEAAFDRLAERV